MNQAFVEMSATAECVDLNSTLSTAALCMQIYSTAIRVERFESLFSTLHLIENTLVWKGTFDKTKNEPCD